MSQQHLNIISFDVPYPANYGGVIDVFYKLKTLSQLGFKIYLHCFEYGRGEQKILNNYAHKVYYYKRSKKIKYLLSAKPFIVRSRYSDELLRNLLSNNAPILFEGLHTCALLAHPKLQERFKIVRTHNIEHDYYKALSINNKNILKKIFFRIEAFKLKLFEKALLYSNLILPISISDYNYFEKYNANIQLVTPFNGNNNFKNKVGAGDYMLFHGNLSVKENSEIVEFLLKNILTTINKPVKIAGLNPPKSLKKAINSFENCQLIENPEQTKMDDLIQNAHIIFLFTNQATGVKLKLIDSLYLGRFCLCNENMIHGTGLTLNSVTLYSKNSYKQLPKVINKLFEQNFTIENIANRKKEVTLKFNDLKNGELIINKLMN